MTDSDASQYQSWRKKQLCEGNATPTNILKEHLNYEEQAALFSFSFTFTSGPLSELTTLADLLPLVLAFVTFHSSA